MSETVKTTPSVARGNGDSTVEIHEDEDFVLSNGARLDLRILGALRRIIQAVDIHSRKLASMHQITAPQLVALLCIVERGPITPSDLAKFVHLSNSTVVGILDRLEAKQLVRRERSTQDRRQVFVTSTPDGVQLAQIAPSPLQDAFARALGELPKLEQVSIALSLERVVELMEAKASEARGVGSSDAV